MRLFVSDDGVLIELTTGDQPFVRVAAPDLQRAGKVRARLRATGDVAVILDVTVAVAGDFRSAREVLGPVPGTVHYAGTVDGLAGLIADIASAGVADGVTLIPASPRQDIEALGREVLRRLALREQPRAS